MPFQLPRRDNNAHKGSCGKLLVVAGSRGMCGAAMLVCRAAYRTGTGYVRLVLPQSLVPFVDVQVPEVVTIGMAETSAGTLARTAQRSILERLTENDTLAIGPGLSRNRDTQQLIKNIVANSDKPMVVDADALDNYQLPITNYQLPIMPPHPGEMARLMNTTVEAVQADRDRTAKEAAQRFKAIIVLKGHHTIVTDGDNLYINETGNPGMATAGMGDVLTGVIAGCLAQGLSPWDAAWCGVYLHGLAGDLVYAEKHTGLIASDVVERLPEAIKISM